MKESLITVEVLDKQGDVLDSNFKLSESDIDFFARLFISAKERDDLAQDT